MFQIYEVVAIKLCYYIIPFVIIFRYKKNTYGLYFKKKTKEEEEHIWSLAFIELMI